MSGHSKWSSIKHKKGIADQKRGQLFSKLSKLISIAARRGTDPETNSELKNTIERAKSFNMPSDNIQRAIKRVSDKDAAQLEELQIEAMGPNSIAFIIQAITDNRNRTISELKNILNKYNIKMVTQNSLLWMFEQKGTVFNPKAPLSVDDPSIKDKIYKFIDEIIDHEDVKEIYSNLEEVISNQ